MENCEDSKQVPGQVKESTFKDVQFSSPKWDFRATFFGGIRL